MTEPPPFDAGPLRIGLTGGIASGKSTVARLFSKRGVPVIDVDQVAREVVEPGEPALEAIVAEFGVQILCPNGRLDRSALRSHVFKDAAARKTLEAIVHPRMLEATVRHANEAGGPYQVIVAPLLVEFGLAGWADRVLVVDCDREIQLQRLLERDGGDRALAEAILDAQATREERLAVADDVINNDGSPDELPEAVARLDDFYRELASRRE